MASMIDEGESFQDVNGKPIVNGYIYVGVAGQDPKLNPVTIYSDRQLTTPLSNPQRTDSYGKSENKIWVSERYSLKVEDSNNVQKYQDLERGEVTGSSITALTNVQGINAVTAEAEPAITSYVDKSIYVFTVANTNTGALTLDAGGGAKSVYKNIDEELLAGEFEAGSIQVIAYNSASDSFELQTPNLSAVDAFIASINSAIDAENLAKIGQIGVSMGSAVPVKSLVASEQELVRASYPDLWTWVQLQSNLVLQATKDADPLTYSAYWGDGDGSTTFTMPNLQGLHLRSFDNGRGLANGQALFAYVEDDNKSHSHIMNLDAFGHGSAGWVGYSVIASGDDQGGTTTEATAAQGGVENTVKSVFLLFYIRVLK